MFAYMNEYSYFGSERPANSIHAREVYPPLMDWEKFLTDSGWRGEPIQNP